MHEILHFVQNDKYGIFMIATQSLKGEEVSELTVGDRSISFRFRFAPPRASLRFVNTKRMSDER